MQDLKLQANDLEIANQKLSKRVEELNSTVSTMSKTTNAPVEDFLKSYKKTNDLIHKNQELQSELENKNEEIESIKNMSFHISLDPQSEGHGSHRNNEEYKSEYSREGSSRPEFDAHEIEISDQVKSKTQEIVNENQLLRDKIIALEEEIMDIQNRNNIVMNQNQKLKHEVQELDAKVFSRISLEGHRESEESTEKKSDKDIDHVKDLLIKFLKETPLTNKSNESLLMIVLSMLYINKVQLDEIQQSRRLVSAQFEEDIVKRNKKSMFGFLGRSKSRK
jgi:chromosome segregation ATPase